MSEKNWKVHVWSKPECPDWIFKIFFSNHTSFSLQRADSFIHACNMNKNISIIFFSKIYYHLKRLEKKYVHITPEQIIKSSVFWLIPSDVLGFFSSTYIIKTVLKQNPGGLSEWGSWSGCSSTCGTPDSSINIRRRTCDNPAPQHGGMDCQGALEEVEICPVPECREYCGIRKPYGLCPEFVAYLHFEKEIVVNLHVGPPPDWLVCQSCE